MNKKVIYSLVIASSFYWLFEARFVIMLLHRTAILFAYVLNIVYYNLLYYNVNYINYYVNLNGLVIAAMHLSELLLRF